MANTTLSVLVNPEVMADMVQEVIDNKAGKFDSVITEDNTLVGRPGNTITVPQWGYIGDAVDVAEGVAMTPTAMSSSTTTAEVKKVGKAVTLTEEAILSGFGDPFGTAARQIGSSVVHKKDTDTVAALDTATTVKGDGTAVVALADILEAKSLFNDEDDEPIEFICHTKIFYDILALCDALNTNLGDYTKVNGELATIYGMRIIRSDKCTVATNAYTSYLAKAGAVKIYNKQATNIKTDEDILESTLIIAGNKHLAVALDNQSKVVLFKALHT